MTRAASMKTILMGLLWTAGVLWFPACRSDQHRAGAGGDAGVTGGGGGGLDGVGGAPSSAGGAGGRPDDGFAGRAGGRGGVASSGGGGAAGGMAGSAGAGGGAVATDCASLGSVKFHLQAAAGAPDYTYVRSFGDPGDGYWWYSVATADGAPLQIFLPSYASTTCGACQDALYPIGFSCSPLTAEGVDADWNGTAMAGQSSCAPSGNAVPSRLSCSVRQCLPAGRYVATMCAFTSALACGNTPTQDHATCVSVPFDYPTSSVVVGTLPP